jgi:hypothetical protein
MAKKRLNMILRELAADQGALQKVLPTVENHNRAVRLLIIIKPYVTVLMHGIRQMHGNHTQKESNTAAASL